MNTSKKHYVTFISPGTFVPETSTTPIESWDPKRAVAIAETIRERYNAKPYGFYFETRLEAEPITLANGETMNVEPKMLKKSACHFLGGKLETVDEVEARNDPLESTLRSNMRGNDIAIVVVNTNSYRSVLPFEEEHVIVDASGDVIERGNDPKHVTYRALKKAQRT